MYCCREQQYKTGSRYYNTIMARRDREVHKSPMKISPYICSQIRKSFYMYNILIEGKKWLFWVVISQGQKEIIFNIVKKGWVILFIS